MTQAEKIQNIMEGKETVEDYNIANCGVTVQRKKPQQL
jgi:hypothetical protein